MFAAGRVQMKSASGISGRQPRDRSLNQSQKTGVAGLRNHAAARYNDQAYDRLAGSREPEVGYPDRVEWSSEPRPSAFA